MRRKQGGDHRTEWRSPQASLSSVVAIARDQCAMPGLRKVDLHSLPQADVAIGPRLPLERAQVRLVAGEDGAFVRSKRRSLRWRGERDAGQKREGRGAECDAFHVCELLS